MDLETATRNGSNERFIHNSVHAGHVEPVPDMLRYYTSATSLDYTLDGDQWIDTRKFDHLCLPVPMLPIFSMRVHLLFSKKLLFHVIVRLIDGWR
jgi:hypothetical protein